MIDIQELFKDCQCNRVKRAVFDVFLKLTNWDKPTVTKHNEDGECGIQISIHDDISMDYVILYVINKRGILEIWIRDETHWSGIKYICFDKIDDAIDFLNKKGLL